MSNGDEANKILAGIGAAVVAALILVGVIAITLLWRTWWLFSAWGWYIVPLGVTPIGFWHFAALLFLMKAATMGVDTKKDDRKNQWGIVVLSVLVWPPIVWAILWWLRDVA